MCRNLLKIRRGRPCLHEVVFKHEAHSDLYLKNVGRFLQCNDELSIGGLGLQSTTSTVEQSHTLTPSLQSQPLIYIDQDRLGSGNFSIVRRVWNVSTGFSYASKDIFNMKESEWRREVEILRPGISALKFWTLFYSWEGFLAYFLLAAHCAFCRVTWNPINLTDYGISST